MNKSNLDARIEQAKKNIDELVDGHNRWAPGKFPKYDPSTYNKWMLRKLLSRIDRYERLQERQRRAAYILKGLGNPTLEELAKARLNNLIDGKTYSMIVDSVTEAHNPGHYYDY